MTVLFSAIAKRKVDLLSIYLTIEQGEDELLNFLEMLESKILQVSQSPQAGTLFLHHNLRACIVSEYTSFVYTVNEQNIVISNLFDSRQNPILTHNDLIEYFS